jgi:hypothetical protein
MASSSERDTESMAGREGAGSSLREGVSHPEPEATTGISCPVNPDPRPSSADVQTPPRDSLIAIFI